MGDTLRESHVPASGSPVTPADAPRHAAGSRPAHAPLPPYESAVPSEGTPAAHGPKWPSKFRENSQPPKRSQLIDHVISPRRSGQVPCVR